MYCEIFSETFSICGMFSNILYPSEIKSTNGENVILSGPEQITTTEDDPHNIKKIAELMKRHHNLIKNYLKEDN